MITQEKRNEYSDYVDQENKKIVKHNLDRDKYLSIPEPFIEKSNIEKSEVGYYEYWKSKFTSNQKEGNKQ